MATYEITVDDDLLQDLLSGNNDGLASLLQQVLNQILEGQCTDQLKADRYERSEDRQGYRNGSYNRKMRTRVGTIELEVPRVRDGEFSTEMFQRYQRSEQALVLSMMEMVVNGVSTRKAKNVTKELCGTEFSKSTVSDLCNELDPMIEAWNERDLTEKAVPFVIVDGLVLRVREDNRVRQKSALIAIGVNEDGYREILGLQMGQSETESSWKEFFRWLKRRGLHGVDMIVSDDHRGLKNAAFQVFQDPTIGQRCPFHFLKNIRERSPKKYEDEIHRRVKEALESAPKKKARERVHDILKDYEEKAPKAMKTLEEGFEDAIAVLALPGKYRRRLRTTNSPERLNEEIRRREKVLRIFPNEESAHRLVGALLVEQHEEWVSGRRYFDMTEYNEWKQKQTTENPADDPEVMVV